MKQQLYTDTEIIQGIKAETNAMLNWVYQHYWDVVFRHVYYKGGSKYDVQEVFQMTMMVVWKNVKDDVFIPEEGKAFRAYFLGVAKKVWLSYLKEKKKSATVDVDSLMYRLESEYYEEIAFDLVTNPTYNRVRRALRQLGRHCEEVIHYRYSFGWKLVEIAEDFGESSATIRQRHMRCMRRLDDLLRQLNIIP